MQFATVSPPAVPSGRRLVALVPPTHLAGVSRARFAPGLSVDSHPICFEEATL